LAARSKGAVIVHTAIAVAGGDLELAASQCERICRNASGGIDPLMLMAYAAAARRIRHMQHNGARS
jgi:hypothetical protein